MQYVGTLVNGTEFDSSSGGYPFTFELGKGMKERERWRSEGRG